MEHNKETYIKFSIDKEEILISTEFDNSKDIFYLIRCISNTSLLQAILQATMEFLAKNDRMSEAVAFQKAFIEAVAKSLEDINSKFFLKLESNDSDEELPIVDPEDVCSIGGGTKDA